MDASKIKQLLSQRVEDLCQYLLPRGARVGNYWHAGSVSGEPGDSLRVCLNGTKRGVWGDFSVGQGYAGSPLDLWMKCRDVDFKTALSQAREWLGVADPVRHECRKEYTKPQHSVYEPLEKTGSKVKAYLVNERKISAKTVTEFGIGRKNGKAIAFPYYEEDGSLAMVKFINLERDARGKKVVSVTSGAKPILFGINTKCVMDSNGVLGICEGEIDAMTWQDEGIPFCSVPFGAKAESDDGKSPNDEWIDNCWDFLADFHTIYVSMDGDEEGQQAARAIIKRLGADRCRMVKLPKKDANECRMAGISLKQFIEAARPVDPEDVLCASEIADEAWKEISRGEEDEIGIPLMGWTQYKFRFRPREGTIWTGYNSHGKTTMLRQFIAWLASKGEPVFVGSYEDSPARFLAKLTRQAAGRFLKSEDHEEFEFIKHHLMQNIIVHAIDGIASWKKFLEQAEYASRRYGVTHAVLDNISSTDLDLDDKQKMDDFTKHCQAFWKSTGVHLHVVAHPRKVMEGMTVKPPSTGDVKGSGTFTDLFWNILAVFRSDKDAPSLHCRKQRDTNDRPDVQLEFCKTSNRFRIKDSPPDNSPYVEYHKKPQSTDLPE